MHIAVLVGGRGKRIGTEKADLKLCGKKLVEIAIEKFSKWDLILVCRDADQAQKLSDTYGCKCVWDQFKNFGALAGVHAALKHFKQCLITAVDMPFIKKELAEFIYKKGVELKCDALVPKHRYAEPLLAYYNQSLIPKIEESIKAGERRILSPLLKAKTVFYPMEKLRKFDKDLISFFNINTREDLARAEELCSEIVTEGL